MDNDRLQQIEGLYCFGEFQLDAEERLLWHDEVLIPLTPKEFEVLFFLVARAGRVATKNELLDTIWEDAFVEESTLARNVSWLRKKLEANGDGERLIETVPKRGYRFAVEVTRIRKDKTLLIVEEETIQHLRLEETITFPPGEVSPKALPDSNALTPYDPKSRIKDLRLIWIAFGALVIAGIGFIVYQIYFQNNQPKTFVASRVVPFSGVLGRENTPAFSPDGKQLAYSWNGGEETNMDIYVRLIGSGEPFRLTNTAANEQYPAFSPDGSHIAFVREFKTHGEVVLIPTLGGPERMIFRLFSANYSISYSPDGKYIAAIDTENSTESGQSAIYLFDLKNGERRRLTAPAKFFGESTPRFSPDGKNLSFVRISSEQKQNLFIVPISGGEPKQLTFDGEVIHSLTWSADGQDIYFVSFRESNQTNIWRIPAKGGSLQIYSTGGKNISNIAASSNGKTLAFVENVTHASIWRLTADGNTPQKLIASSGLDRDPQFSPDGNHIVFMSDRTGISEIWTADANGKNLRQITDTPLEVSSPQFSHDNSQIVYHLRDGDDVAIIIVPAEGGVAKKVSPDGVKSYLPSWSADGKWIYSISNRTGSEQLWRFKANGGGEATQITHDGAVMATPSPDGKTVFLVKSFDSNELFQIPANGGDEKSIKEITSSGFTGRWAINPGGIFFLVPDPDLSFKIKYYDFASGGIKYFAEDIKIPFNIFGAGSASADGKTFLYSAEEPNTSRLMLAEFPETAN